MIASAAFAIPPVGFLVWAALRGQAEWYLWPFGAMLCVLTLFTMLSAQQSLSERITVLAQLLDETGVLDNFQQTAKGPASNGEPKA